MSTFICVSIRKAAAIMLDNGFDIDQIKLALADMNQPSLGFYKVTDVMDYIRNNSMQTKQKTFNLAQ